VGQQTFVDYLSINVKKVPDRRVRQAIAMAIDKTAYVTAWGGATAGVAPNSVISRPAGLHQVRRVRHR